MSSRNLAILAGLLVTVGCAELPTHTRSEAPPPAAVTTTAAVTVVMSGLDSPRGLAFGPEGALYVAEAGTTQTTGLCVPIARDQNCYSGTGAVTRLWRGVQERVVSGLPSVYNPGFNDITGPHDVSFVGRGNMHVSIGWGGDPAARAGFGDLGAGFGSLLTVQPSGTWRVVADVAAYESAHNPAGGPVDSNLYGVLAEPGRRYVADAGANALLRVSAAGDVSLAALLPTIPVPPPFNPPFVQAEPVPTEVTRGPDGALYVSTLTGVPFSPGSAGIYRIADGQASLHTGGFTAITDFDWAPDGTLFVLQYASAPFLGGVGSLVSVAPSGARTTVATGLQNPTGVVVGSDGAVYVSNRGNLAGVGEVLRIEQ